MTPEGLPRLDPDRTLALSYVPRARRAALGALWRLDAALGAVLAAGRDPMISRIKLAWWRDSLEKLDRERAPPEPVLRVVKDHVLPAGISGGQLAGMEEGWGVLLSDEPLTMPDLTLYAEGRGGRLFHFSTRLLGARNDPDLDHAGGAWALVDLARHVGNRADADAALAMARERTWPRCWPSPLRPLGMLAMLAKKDLEAGPDRWQAPGAPGRMLRMLGHRLTGY